MRPLRRVVLALAAAGAAVACGSLVDPEGNGGGAVSPAVRGLRLDAATVTLAVDETRQVNVTAVNVAGQPVPPPPGQSIQLSSSDPAIFTVSPAGQLRGIASGTAVLRAQLGTLSVGAGVIVIDNVDRLELVRGGGQTAAPGAPLADPLVVRAVAAGGAVRAGVTVTFAPSAGSVSPTTAVTAADGTASTRWTLGGTAGAQTVLASAPGFRSVTVGASAVARPVVTIDVAPPSATLTDVGRTQQFTARALDAAGAEIPGVAFTWSSSRTDVAVVNSTGLATAVAAGSSTITAAAGTVSGSAALTVTVPQPAPRLLLEPTSVTASATQTSTAAPQVLAPVQLREATGRPLADLGALTTDAPVYTTGQPTGWITARTLNTTTGALVLTVDPVNLTPGTYTATVPVRAALASNTPQSLAVQLTVTAASAPRIVVAPERWDPLRPARAVDAVTLDVAVTNGGSGTLNGLTAEVTYAAGQATGWLTATIGAAAPATLRLIASAAALDAGVYDGTVTIRSSVSGVAAVPVPVRLTVTAVGPPRVFLNGAEISSFIRNDSVVIGTATLYGTVDESITVAFADASGQRRRPSAPSTPTFFGNIPDGAPREPWLQAAAVDSGVELRIRHTPVLLAGLYRSATTVSVPGLSPLVVVLDYGLQQRLVALAGTSDTTSIVTGVRFLLDQGGDAPLPSPPFLRQIGGWCRRGEYRVVSDDAPSLPPWLITPRLLASSQFQAFSLFATPLGVAPGQVVNVAPRVQHDVPLGETRIADCPTQAADLNGFTIEAQAPAYRLRANVDTLDLVDIPGEDEPSGVFDLDVVPAVAAPPCESFAVPQVSVQLLLDPADEADGLDGDRVGRGAGLGIVLSTRPTGVTQAVAIDTTGLRRGRSYVYGLAYRSSFRCPDGVQPYSDTLWVRFSTSGGGGTTGTLSLRGRGAVGVPGDTRPFEAYLSSVNPNSEAVGPAGYPTYNISLYYAGGPVPAGDNISVSNIAYSGGGAGWLDVVANGTNVGDTVAFYRVELARARPTLPRGNYRATVTLRSSVTGQTVSFPVTHVVGGRDGLLEFTQLTTGANSGCGIAGDPSGPTSGNQLFCWGAIGAGLVPFDEPAGYWHERAGNVAQFPVPMSDSVLRAFSNGVTLPRIRQVATASLNIALLVESSRDGRNYVLVAGNFAFGQSTNPAEDFRGMRPLRDGSPLTGALVTARSIAVGLTGTRACAISEAGQPFCWGQQDPAFPIAATGALQQFPTPEPMDSVVLGGGHACAWAVGGNAYCWGGNVDGQLGRGTIGGNPPLPVAQVPGLSDVRSMSAAAFTTCARTGTGIFCWGSNQSGIIYGRALGTRFGSPQAVTPPVLDFQFRQSHACGRSNTTPGALFCWGVEFAPGGAVSGPTGTRPLATGYREALWPASLTQYHVGDATTCYAEFRLWRCSGGVAQFVATGGGNVSVTTPQFLLGQQPRLIADAGFRAAGATTVTALGSDGVLAPARQWLRGLFNRDAAPSARTRSLKLGNGANAPARGARPVWRALPARQLGGGALPPQSPSLPRVAVRTMPLDEFLRRPKASSGIRVWVGPKEAGGHTVRGGRSSFAPPPVVPRRLQ